MQTLTATIQHETPLEFEPLNEFEIKNILREIEGLAIASNEQSFAIQFCLDALTNHRPDDIHKTAS